MENKKQKMVGKQKNTKHKPQKNKLNFKNSP